MLLLVARILLLLALLSFYGVNVVNSDSPLFAFFYQPNFIVLLVILFIIGTFFKIVKVFFTIALLLGIGYYGYSYYIGESPLSRHVVKSVSTVASAKEKTDETCDPNASWIKRMTHPCYSSQLEN